jgi:colicin import membrane protein
MSSIAMSRDAFMPRSTGGGGPGFVYSLLIHAALVAALALGVRWHASQPEGVEAELWAAVPQVMAPKAVEPPPVVKPEPPVVTPPPVVKPEPTPDAQIAIERAKKEEKARKQKELEEKEAEKRLAEKKKALEEEKKRKAEEARLAAQHEAQVKRILAQAGATGDPTSMGRATQTAGPSAGYAAKIRAAIKPNITYSDAGAGNPLATVEVRCGAEGTIIGKRLVKSSGVPAWDEAVLRAIDKTDRLPRDIDGRVPSPIEIDFRPRDF